MFTGKSKHRKRTYDMHLIYGNKNQWMSIEIVIVA